MSYVKTITISSQSWRSLRPEALVLGLYEEERLTDFASKVDVSSGGIISRCISSGDFTGKKNKTMVLYSEGPARRIVLVGLGKRGEFTLDCLRQAAGTAVKTAQSLKWKHLTADIPGRDVLKESWKICTQAFVEGLILGSYKFLDYKTDTKNETILDSITLINNPSKSGVKRGQIISKAVCYVRDLASHPSNVVTPTRLALEAGKIAQQYHMNCTVFDREQIERMGMGAFTSVAKGTDEPPKFILMEYKKGKKGDAPIAFVGKGITFDTGGISLKPSKAMDEMKYDMSGAGAVLGIMKAVGELRPAMNIMGVIASTENMPGGHATKPGDIIKAYNGKTIEILSTDAEGRLVLADVLSYVSKNMAPQCIVDFATLTGSVVVALGHFASGVMGTDSTLLQKIKDAGEVTGERVWELPLWDDYCKDIESKVADVKNIGAFHQAGTIAGGAFLKEFVGDIPWVHIDIAGTAWWDKDRPYIPAGASGVGVRLSLELLNLL